ncbi:class I SAM-dependent DNA methyltransferase [Streptacidiphilus cavernicola]|uniref:Class I SAM-dependent methyltransferase n=1 Tax=Streptacidiphilus cavernicola TaxID=3342716 RepID=A0ABV6VVJ6_9ACTN
MRSTQPKDLPGDGSAEAVRQYYDRFAEQEEHRLTKDIPGRVSFDIHRRFLARHIKPGWRVLEIGAGPGTFTVALADLGAQVVVADLSPVQLALNAQFVAAAGAEHAVERREVADIRDLSAYRGGDFDAVVAYGGPLSYAFEQEQRAMAELVRVVRLGGVVLASVMSLWGTWRARLPGATALELHHGTAVGDRVLSTGDLRHVPGMEHVCRMFTWAETVALVAGSGAQLIDGSASNWASLHDLDFLAGLETEPSRWQQFLDREATACAAEGARDGGTHILFAAVRGT